MAHVRIRVFAIVILLVLSSASVICSAQDSAAGFPFALFCLGACETTPVTSVSMYVSVRVRVSGSGVPLLLKSRISRSPVRAFVLSAARAGGLPIFILVYLFDITSAQLRSRC